MGLVVLKNLLFGSRQTIQSKSAENLTRTTTDRTSSRTTTTSTLNEKANPTETDVEAQTPSATAEKALADSAVQPIEQQALNEKRSRFRWAPSPRMTSDIIIGLSDGLTVPFALTAGISTLGTTRLVKIAGFAELIAGAISMGLGGYLGSKSEAESYTETLRTTVHLVDEDPAESSRLIHNVISSYGVTDAHASQVASGVMAEKSSAIKFLMSFHHEMPEPASSRPLVCAISIALGYFIGGLVPLIPYFCVPENNVLLGLWISIGCMVFALFVFGWVKTGFVSGFRGRRSILLCLKSAIEMVVIGSAAAGAAVGIVRAINSDTSS